MALFAKDSVKTPERPVCSKCRTLMWLTSHVELARSFRIESGDGRVNERWGRCESGWKLLSQ